MHEQTVNRGGDAPRVGNCGSDRDSGTPPSLNTGWVEMVSPATGNKILVRPPRQWPTEIKPKHPVPGLQVFESTMSLKFQWTRPDPIDEPEAIDAQCRAGWNDQGYGFYSFEVQPVPEGFRATWCCWKSCE